MKYSAKFLRDIANNWKYIRNAANSTRLTEVEYGFRVFIVRGKYVLSRVIVGGRKCIEIPYVRGMVGALHTHPEPSSFSDNDKYSHYYRYSKYYRKWMQNPESSITAVAYVVPVDDLYPLVIEAYAGIKHILEFPYIVGRDWGYLDYSIKIFGPIPVNLYGEVIKRLRNRPGARNLPVEMFLV